MRTLLPFVFILLLASCGQSEQNDRSDSVNDSVITYSSAFDKANATAAEIAVPCLIHTDSLPEREGFSIAKADAQKLFPPEFDYSDYKKVTCIGRSEIRKLRVLWYELKSAPEDDGSPDATDVLMVLYDEQGEPVDVYNTATADAGYRLWSYVRADSVFSVDVSGQDDVTVLTTAIAITGSGFMPAPSQSKTFHSDEKGNQEKSAYTTQYINARRSQR